MHTSLDLPARTAELGDGTDRSFCFDSPRFVEACKRCGVTKTDLVERSEGFFRRRPSAKAADEFAPAVRHERHEVNRHRLLREVFDLTPKDTLNH